MDGKIESAFVSAFIHKRWRARLKMEFSEEKRRRDAIDRFCHTTDKIIKPSAIYLKTNKERKVLPALRELTDLEECYVVSSKPDMDGKHTTVEKAMEACMGYGMPSIIIIGNAYAIIETEPGLMVRPINMCYIIKLNKRH